MRLDTDLSDVLNGLGAGAVSLLGVWILLLKPRTPVNRALGAFLLGFGGFAVPSYLLEFEMAGEQVLEAVYRAVAQGLGAVGLAALLARFPRPLERRDAAGLALASLFAAAYVAARVADEVLGGAAPFTETSPALSILQWAHAAASIALYALLGAAPLLLAWRYSRLPDAATRAQAATMAGALLVYVGFLAGAAGSEDQNPLRSDLDLLLNLPYLLACALSVALWLRASAGPEHAARSRNLALLAAGMPLVGLLYAAAGKGFGGYGATRTVFVLALAYAILRSQLLGLDVKARWTISKSTVAAVFVAVFFVASEGAQVVFGAGNQWMGLVAAGALVFAMAPLQRAAERLAERAVPVAAAAGSAPSAAAPSDDREATFRRAARWALRDGALSHEEERHLLQLGFHLGISPLRASELRDEVEREALPGVR